MEIIEPRRDDDACLLVSIDGGEKSILIEQANDCAKNLLECEFDEEDDKNFFSYLSDSTLQSFCDYFDFNDEFYDLTSLLSRMRNAKLKTKNGIDVPVIIKVFPCVGDEIDKSYYQLLIRDVGLSYDLDSFRYSFEGGNYLSKTYVSDFVDLMDESTTHKELNFFCSFMKEKYVFPMCIIIIRFSNDDLSINDLHSVKNKFAFNLRKKIREEDEIGEFDERSLCCMVLDFDIHNVQSILNRIENLIVFLSKSDEILSKINIKSEIYYLSIPDINFASDVVNAIRKEISLMKPEIVDKECNIIGRVVNARMK